MRKNLLLSAAICCIAAASFATTHTITASGTSFSPSSGVTVHLGDTVKWVLAGGSHTSTSTSVPSGAATWNQTLSSTPFIYVPSVVGAYAYQCNFHASMGMTGTFTVIGSTGATTVPAPASLFSMFPNPAAQTVRLNFVQQGPVSVMLTDMNGKIFLNKDFASSADAIIDVKNVPAGIYVVAAKQGGDEYKQQLQVTH